MAELLQQIEREFEFPLTRAAVVDRFGEETLDAPDRTSSESLSTVLSRGGEDRYQSKTDLLEAISGNLSDEYIGRKYYDDRGHNPTELEHGSQEDTVDVSF